MGQFSAASEPSIISIFINDLEEDVEPLLSEFAGDTETVCMLKANDNRLLMLSDLDCLVPQAQSNVHLNTAKYQAARS